MKKLLLSSLALVRTSTAQNVGIGTENNLPIAITAVGLSEFDIFFKINESLVTKEKTYTITGGTGYESLASGLCSGRFNINKFQYTFVGDLACMYTGVSPKKNHLLSANTGTNWPDYSVFLKRLY